MDKPDLPEITEFQELLLAAILLLGENAYGVTIDAKMNEFLAPQRANPGKVWLGLQRLEEMKLVASWWADPTPERGNKPKRYYKVLGLGQRALEKSSGRKDIRALLDEAWGTAG